MPYWFLKHCSNSKTIVLARTIIARKTYKRYRHIIDYLDHQSIGEHFLFQSSMVTHSTFMLEIFLSVLFMTGFQGKI